MPIPKTLREHLEDGTLGPLRTRAQVEREEELLARVAELERTKTAVVLDSREMEANFYDTLLERDALRSRVAELEAAIQKHRDRTIVKTQADGELWSTLEPA